MTEYNEIKEENKQIQLNGNYILSIVNSADFINRIYKENLTYLDNKYIITTKDKKIMKIIFKYLSKVINQRIKKTLIFINKRKPICKKNKSQNVFSVMKNYSASCLNIFISNFINICSFNNGILQKYLRSKDWNISNILSKIVKFLFLNDYIDENDLKIILGFQLFLSLYNNNNEKSEKIENVKKIYLVINFLLSFCNVKPYKLTESKIKQIIALQSFLIQFLKEHILINFANVCLLSRNKSLLKMIEFCQIAPFKERTEIMNLLVEVYKYKLNIDFILDDLSEQFLYSIEKDSLSNKTKLLIEKNNFLNSIFKKETQLIKGEIIKNGFYFSDFPNNGIQCEPINKFPNSKKGYSIVVSFRLMVNIEKGTKNKKFTIFSLTNKDNNIIMNVYIEDNKVKISNKKKKVYELDNEIIINKSYILWIFHFYEKKQNMIIYLNETKTTINKMPYPEGNYRINLGCNIDNNNISFDNFIGKMGTFILFNKCLIKDENDNRNITKLIELKGNYEGIPYVDVKKEWAFVEKSINITLNLLSKDKDNNKVIDKNKDIELIISSKNFGNENLIYNSDYILNDCFENGIYCNYFQNPSIEKVNHKFYFRNKDFLENNQSFPLFSHNSFFDFLNCHGFLFLQTELYYFIGLISLNIEERNKDKTTNNIKIFDNFSDEEDFYTYLTEICSFFFTCIDYLNSSICFNSVQIDMFQKEIQNFKYTLIDLITILSKYNCKIKIYFLKLFCQKIKEKKYFEYCSFILNFQFYDLNDNQIFNVIFSELNDLLKEDCDNTQIKIIFLKLISFDKLYILDSIDKNVKHEYSKIMRILIQKSIDEELKECLDEFKNRLNKLKTDFSNDNISNDMSNIPEEDYNYGKRSEKLSMDSSYNKEGNCIKELSSRKESSCKRESVESISTRNNDKNLEYLVLIYKYLKNLYISLYNKSNKFVELFDDKKDKLADFFNDLFDILSRVYPIDANYFEKDLKAIKAVKISELIKCFCIRFLDDFFFKENYNYIKEEEEKLKNKGEDMEDLDNKSTNSRKSNISTRPFFSSRSTYIKTNQKGSFITGNSARNLFLNIIEPNSNSTIKQSNSFISNFNIANKTVEEILTKQMEFFDDFILSPYTFRSFILMLFRNYPNDKKIKFIKNKKDPNFDFSLQSKKFKKIKLSLKVILKLLEKLNSDDIDTFFATKKELIEYIYKIFSELFKNTLTKYLNETPNEEDNSMIKSLFIYQKNICYADKFYKIMLADILSIKENYEESLIKIQTDMKSFIKESIFHLEDLFIFKTLREIFFEKNNNLESFVFNFEIFLMEIISEKFSRNEKNKIIEINCKNTLILLYKTIFFVNKRSKILENESFLKEIFTFLSQILDHSSILYTKILFLIDDSRGKLLIEIIYEIIFELYLEYLKNPQIKSLRVADPLLRGLFNKNKFKTSLGAEFKEDSIFKFLSNEEDDFSPFYIMDKISDTNYSNKNKKNINITNKFSINRSFFEFREQILEKYKNERIVTNNIFSTSIIFSIKLILSIKELYDFYAKNKNNLSSTNSSNSETNNSDEKNKDSNDNIIDANDDMIINELKSQFANLCKNIQRMQKESKEGNPFKSMGFYSKNIYEHFRSFIVEKLKFKNSDYIDKIEELIQNINNHNRDLKPFMRVIYTNDGKTKEYNEKTIDIIYKNIKKEAEDAIKNQENESFSSVNDMKSKKASATNLLMSKTVNFELKIYDEDFEIKGRKTFNKTLGKKPFYLNVDSSHSQKQLFKKFDILSKSILDKFKDKIIYKPRTNFRKDLIRKYFSIYFRKILTYDEDFINIKKLYTFTYEKEIKEIDKYKISYPTRIKNYISNNYDKIFLKKDFDFFTNGYFNKSHNYLSSENYNYKYKFQNKYIFPNKNFIRENDCLFDEIFSKNISNAPKYDCEMITIKGSIFGNIYIFDNCLFFKSDVENDKRKVKEKDYETALFFACCTVDYDFIKKEKRIIMEYDNIKEVINRTIAYIWISVEIFLKDGRSFLFNLFNEDLHSEFFETLKRQNVPIIKKVGEYFRKEEFSKKWKEEKITTYDYLLLLNKFASRSYNDTNQYPVMPWLFLIKGKEKIRNFDLPMSVQDEKTQKELLSKWKLNLGNEQSLIQTNHYSTAAYLYYYLMRVNPFTNMMIKFQSGNFDLPDRQYFDIKETINLCQYLSNNRELLPELYSLPEAYLNLNDNDFGKQKQGVRVHNISFQPYANDPFQFCYFIKDLMNNNNKINNEINKWFDFIFGINQLGNYSSDKNMNNQEREKYRILRKFNIYCYGKLYNYNKIVLEAQKHSRDNKSLFTEIKDSINFVNNFGQCPYQILNEIHPSKNKYLSNLKCSPSKYNYQFETNIFDEGLSNDKNIIYNSLYYNENTEDFSHPLGQTEIIFFTKSSINNYFYLLLKNGTIEIYKFEPKYKKNFALVKEVKPKCQFLSLKENKITKNQVFNPKFLFCEFNENSFLFGRTLDRTLIYYNFVDNFETSFLLKSYIISIISIKNNEFITGNDNGYLCKWRIDIVTKEKKSDIELELLLMVKSNLNAITSLYYDERLNVIISSDANSLVMRKIYDFEYLNSIKINEKDDNKFITDIKISDFNFIYVLVYNQQTTSYELKGYTLNGIYFGKYKGIIFNFEISKTGKIIINELIEGQLKIRVLHPVNFDDLQTKEITGVKGESFHFYFEKPNIIYYGIKDNESTKIKIKFLIPEERNIFYMNEVD